MRMNLGNRFGVMSPRATLLLGAISLLASQASAHPVPWVEAMGEGSTALLSPNTGVASVFFRPEPGLPLPAGSMLLWSGYAAWRGTRGELAAAKLPANAEVQSVLRPTMNAANGVIRSTAAHDAGITGRGVVVGVVDSGLDLKHKDFRDSLGNSRVKWLLDYSQTPAGLHPELEARYAVVGITKKLMGAVLSSEDIARWERDGAPTGWVLPEDIEGHGTHVTGIAAGSKVTGSAFSGVAPESDLVIVHGSIGGAAETEVIVRGTAFVFEQADALGRPAVVNLSLSDDLGPHDGTAPLEALLAAQVGPTHPGHAIVVAAGNSGLPSSGHHQRVFVSGGTTILVPVVQSLAVNSGNAQIYVLPRKAGSVKVGLEGPGGIRITPVAAGGVGVQQLAKLQVGVVYTRTSSASKIPEGSQAAWVAWTGASPAGTYNVVLEGEGLVDLYMQAIGTDPPSIFANFADGVREGSVGLPATHPDMIAVGCTALRTTWNNVLGLKGLTERSRLDDEGGAVLGVYAGQPPEVGQICSFSGAGPTLAGIPRPDISAPGFAVASAMSAKADPRARKGSDLSDSSCLANPKDPKGIAACGVVDATHVILSGTSMSSPMVAGAVALLLQVDPTLTQQKIRALLQAGAQPFRGPAPFFAQSGPGELDVAGSLLALQRSKQPVEALPDGSKSWMRPSDDYVDSSGATPATLLVELRTADGSPADLFDATRLTIGLSDGAGDRNCVSERLAPGLWRCVYSAPKNTPGPVTFSVALDGKQLLTPLTLRSAADPWTSRYATKLLSSCSFAPSTDHRREPTVCLAFGLLALARLRSSRKKQ